MKIVAVTGSMSEASSATGLANRIERAVTVLGEQRGVEVKFSTLTLRNVAHDLVNMTLTHVPSPDLEKAFEQVAQADAVLAVTPVYNAAPMGLFTLFWQLMPVGGLQGKTVLLAATGGTARHSLVLDSQVRPIFSYLKGIVLPTTVYAATEDWAGPAGASSPASRAEAAANELLSLTCSIRTGVGGPDHEATLESVEQGVEPARAPDEFDPANVTLFEDLLKQS